MTAVIDKLFNSIVFRMGSMMFVISFVAIISMFSSVFISEMADKDSLAINHAGTLRMQSYKLLANLELKHLLPEEQLESHLELMTAEIIKFETKLNAPVLSFLIQEDKSSIISSSLSSVKLHWYSELHPKLTTLLTLDNITTNQLITLNQQVDQFVIEIDKLVYLYQQHAEDRILLIRMIQGISLFITVILVVLIMFQLNTRVEKPLSELTDAAKQIMAGDYTAHTHLSQNDEFGLLSKTMNKMTDAISQSHLQLEKRVQAKTAKLKQSKDSLELLYETANCLSQTTDNLDLDPIIKKLSVISGLDDLDLCLITSDGNSPYEHIITIDNKVDDKCVTSDCRSCINDTVACEIHNEQIKKQNIRYPIVKDNINYGVLVCNLHSDRPLETWQHQLLASISSQISIGLKLRSQSEQSRRLTLVNERTTIARELHDSLAQALSYLKIQVTRLQKLLDKEAGQDKIDEVVVELKSGLNDAYRQLRELLTTFRLKIDTNGFKSTFEQTIQQLNVRSNEEITFELDYQVDNLPLSPVEEVHIMQIAREATQNALHHSKAKLVKISLSTNLDDQITLIIEDDGIGMPDSPEKLNHYGLAIMQERASQLGATLKILSAKPHGTVVELTYSPKSLKV